MVYNDRVNNNILGVYTYMQHEIKTIKEEVEIIDLTTEEYEALNKIFQTSLKSRYPTATQIGVPNIDRIVIIGGAYRAEFPVNIKD